ncbi:Uncharacterised protein [Vibrio cholerae]|nr:Uncharacterised protein [Vibrio cholerae]CSI73861.1 Uncharacterised protein [Vibrio cholerae]
MQIGTDVVALRIITAHQVGILLIDLQFRHTIWVDGDQPSTLFFID